MKLKPQYQKFVEAYASTFNATKSAIVAGYSPKTARVQGCRLLTKAAIKVGVKAIFDKASMDPAEIAARWTALARAGLDDFYTKVETEKLTTIEQPLGEAIAEIEAGIAYDREYMERAWEVLGLDEEARSKELLDHDRHVKHERLRILRYAMQLERNPDATRAKDGPKLKVVTMQLDLVKAADLGLLDLVKSITPTEHGTKLELRSPDAALDNLAKWQGMLTTKIDLTSAGEPVAAPAILPLLTVEEKKRLLQARRQANAAQGGAPNA